MSFFSGDEKNKKATAKKQLHSLKRSDAIQPTEVVQFFQLPGAPPAQWMVVSRWEMEKKRWWKFLGEVEMGDPGPKYPSIQIWKKKHAYIIYQVIQFVTFSSPNVRGHQQPFQLESPGTCRVSLKIFQHTPEDKYFGFYPPTKKQNFNKAIVVVAGLTTSSSFPSRRQERRAQSAFDPRVREGEADGRLMKDACNYPRKIQPHPDIAHPFGNPPKPPTMKGIPLNGMLAKVARGVFQRYVETTLECRGSIIFLSLSSFSGQQFWTFRGIPHLVGNIWVFPKKMDGL